MIPLVAHAGVRYAFEEVMGKMYKRCIFIDDTTNATYTYTVSLLTSSAATAARLNVTPRHCSQMWARLSNRWVPRANAMLC